MFAAACAVDQQDSRRRCRLLLPAFGLFNPLARSDPIAGTLIGGIGEARARGARLWGFAVLRIRQPRRLRDAINFVLPCLEGRIEKALAISSLEFGFVEVDPRHFLANGKARHRLGPFFEMSG